MIVTIGIGYGLKWLCWAQKILVKRCQNIAIVKALTLNYRERYNTTNYLAVQSICSLH